MTHVTPTATFLDKWTVELRFPFNRTLVDDLKLKIPASCRSWDPIEKAWTVQAPDPYWAKLATELLQWAFPYATVTEPSSSRQRHATELDEDFRVLHLLPSAPPALVRAARKVLALESHPDRGGDHGRMVAINLAYEHLEERGCA